MFRWVSGFAMVVVAAVTVDAQAQLPSAGSTGLKYQVVSPSSAPLSAPIPSVGTAQQKKPSFFGRFYETLAKYLPFVPARKPTLAPPQPTTQKMPNQGPGIQIQQTGGGIPLPQIPPLIQGGAR